MLPISSLNLLKPLLKGVPFLLLLACHPVSEEAVQKISLSPTHEVLFLDSLDAARQITQDQKEFFFEQIGKLDMSLQLKKNYPENTPRSTILKEYKALLQTDVANFNPDEIHFIREIFQEIFEACQQQLDISFFPPIVSLIKTKMKHYGPGVFYTREQAIIIPQDELDFRNKSRFKEVMIHELFHIYSRYHLDKRNQLYERIGFSAPPCPAGQIVIPAKLRKRILLNPDGINYNYSIQLTDESMHSFSALPILFSNRDAFTMRQPHFTAYMRFQLFPVQKEQCQLKPFSSFQQLTDLTVNATFLDQIEENTSYIIHPDEILAENMVLLFQTQVNNPFITPLKVTPEGKQLLKDIERILKD